MHEIHTPDVTEEFARCWSAAGRHIQKQAQSPLQSWLRSSLNPPFLEHLSFRLGNQLFFIQLEDIDSRLQTPGRREGLFTIADGCAGHACVMPMRRVGANWEPTEAGWGLLNARTRQAVDPFALISDEKIVMTDWELQDFSVQVVREQLAKDGKELISWNGDPHIHPSLWFVGDSAPEWVVVKAVRYPSKEAVFPESLSDMTARFNELGHSGHFASLILISVDDPFDPDAAINGNVMPLYRGHGIHGKYKGLQKL